MKTLKHQWKTGPISATCESYRGKGTFCGLPTTYAYPAMHCGWMALCHEHAQRHIGAGGARPITELFLQGETIVKRDPSAPISEIRG